MHEPEDNAENVSPAKGRMPTGAEAATLHDRVAAVMRVLESAAEEARGAGGATSPRLLEKYRPLVAAAMAELGETLADFVEASTGAIDLERLQSEFLEPILAFSRILPVFGRAREWAVNNDENSELREIVLEGRTAGFDVQSQLLGDFYQQGAAAGSVRARAVQIMRLLRDELAARGAFEGRRVRVLVLGANGVSGLNMALKRGQLPESARRASLFVFIVDPLGHALRRVRHTVEQAFHTRPDVLLASPTALATHPNRPTRPFEIIYTPSQYDVLSLEEARAFTESILQFLEPGGVLLTGCHLPVLPRSGRALALTLAGLRWELWDAAKWEAMLSTLPFDLTASRFEAHPPAALVVAARRKEEGGA